jgi:hypothetical protein
MYYVAIHGVHLSHWGCRCAALKKHFQIRSEGGEGTSFRTCPIFWISTQYYFLIALPTNIESCFKTQYMILTAECAGVFSFLLLSCDTNLIAQRSSCSCCRNHSVYFLTFVGREAGSLEIRSIVRKLVNCEANFDDTNFEFHFFLS